MGIGSKQKVIWRRKISAVCWVWEQFDASQFLNFCHVRAGWGPLIVLLQENSISVNECWVSPTQNVVNSSQLLRINIHIDCKHFCNKLPVNHTFKFQQTHNITLGLTHFWSYVAIILINLSFMVLPISWRQISTLRWVCWGVNPWGTDLHLLYDFPRVLMWRCVVSFDAPSSSDSLIVLFCRFSSKTLSIFSISHNLGLPEHGKYLVFFLLQCWNVGTIVHTLTNGTLSFHFTYYSSLGSSFIIFYPVVL